MIMHRLCIRALERSTSPASAVDLMTETVIHLHHRPQTGDPAFLVEDWVQQLESLISGQCGYGINTFF